MDFNGIINRLNTKQNGSIFKIEYTGTLPLTAAAKKNNVQANKCVTLYVRKGIDYDKQKAVQKKVANGKTLTHELPWGQWKDNYEGLVIEHKDNTYIRFYNGFNKPITKYYLNNIECSLEELENSNCIIKSYFNTAKSNSVDALTININNIKTIY